jgi:hypothetical protein
MTITDEDDALLQVINHGSIHHAGFLSEQAVFALSHDEVFSVHPITNPDSDEANDPTPIQFGDLRQPLNCEYVVQTLTGPQGTYLAAGNTTYVDLVKSKYLSKELISETARIDWISSQSHRIPGGTLTTTMSGDYPALMAKKLYGLYILTKR